MLECPTPGVEVFMSSSYLKEVFAAISFHMVKNAKGI